MILELTQKVAENVRYVPKVDKLKQKKILNVYSYISTLKCVLKKCIE